MAMNGNTAKSDNPYLTDELLIVRHSGEIPEVALHGSLYFLTRDPDGPTLELNLEEIRALKAMVVERYLEIIQRDLEPANRDKPLYRGLNRALVNWRRLTRFCWAEGWETETYRRFVGESLLSFLGNEIMEVDCRGRASSVNCDAAELLQFTQELGIEPKAMPAGWEKLCR